MIFRTLELKNFRSHLNTKLNFNNGITLIVGQNGAGKSSIFEAITFALFSQANVKNNELVRTNKGIKDNLTMEVKLTFESNKEFYRVERKIIKSIAKRRRSANSSPESFKSEANLFKINKDLREIHIAEGVKEVNEEIKEILMMDSTTFLSAIHIRQGQISKLIDEAPYKRKELIGQLLKLDDLKKAHENIKAVIQDMESKKQVYDDSIKPSQELEENLEKIKSDCEILTQTDKILQTQRTEIEDQLKAKVQEKNELDVIKNKYESLKRDLNHQEENLENLNKYNHELTGKLLDIQESEKEIELLTPNADKLTRFNEFKENHLKLNNLKLDESNKNDIIAQNDSYKEIIMNEKENNDKYLELSKEIEELENNKKALSFEINRLEELEAKKITTENDISNYNKQLDEFYSQSMDILNDFDFEKDISDASLEDLENIVLNLIGDVECQITEINAKREEYVSKTAKLNHDVESTKESLEDISKVENRCPTCQSKISEAKKEELINEYNATISTNTKKIEEINDLVDEIKNKKELKETSLSNLNSIKNKLGSNKIILDNINKLTSEAEELTSKIEEIQSKKETFNELNVTLEAKHAEFENLESSHKEYDLAQNLLKSVEEEQEIKNHLIALSDDIKQIEQKLESLIKEESELSLDISEDELNKHIEDLNEKNSRLIYLVAKVDDKAEFEEKLKINTQEIEKTQYTLEDINKTIEEFEYDEENHSDVIKSVEDLDKNLNELNISIIRNQKDLEIKNKDIENLNKDIEKNNEVIEKSKAAKDYIDLLKYFKFVYGKDGIQKDLRNKYKDSIQMYARDFFEKFKFNYSDLILSDEYDISLSGPEGYVNLDMVSGGEKIAIALSLRLAITQVMSKGNIETILLDEPTIHLDKNRKDDLIEVLNSVAVIPQMIIVTHEEELENAAGTIINIKKENGISSVEDNS